MVAALCSQAKIPLLSLAASPPMAMGWGRVRDRRRSLVTSGTWSPCPSCRSNTGKISHLNAIILGESLASEENDLVFPSPEFSAQVLIDQALKIRSWLEAAPFAVKTLFSGERILCDHVFTGSDSICESCFTDITCDAAALFLGLPETVAKSKRSPEKLFWILDLYEAISKLWPEIETIFSFESTSIVRSQALESFLKLAEAVQANLADFEVAIHKDASKSPVPGGELHPLTHYVMNYLVFLADYDAAFADVYSDFPLEILTPFPKSFDSPSSPSPTSDGGAASAISLQFA